MKIHALKTDFRPFSNVWDGEKPFEIRKDDRNFKNGDVLLLREMQDTGEAMIDGAPLEYTGREILAKVTSKLVGYGVKNGWCALSIKKLDQSIDNTPWDGLR